MSFCLSVCNNVIVCRSFCLCVCLFVCLFVCLSVFICTVVCVFVCLSVCLYVLLSVCLSVCFVCVFVCVKGWTNIIQYLYLNKSEQARKYPKIIFELFVKKTHITQETLSLHGLCLEIIPLNNNEFHFNNMSNSGLALNV